MVRFKVILRVGGWQEGKSGGEGSGEAIAKLTPFIIATPRCRSGHFKDRSFLSERVWETGCAVLSLAVDKHVTSPHTLSGGFALTMP